MTTVDSAYKPPFSLKPGVFLRPCTTVPYIIACTPIDTLHVINLHTGESQRHLRVKDPQSVTYEEAKKLLGDPRLWHFVETWDELEKFIS